MGLAEEAHEAVGSLLTRDAEVSAAACRDRVHQASQLRGWGRRSPWQHCEVAPGARQVAWSRLYVGR
jgi:hypothetical protein